MIISFNEKKKKKVINGNTQVGTRCEQNIFVIYINVQFRVDNYLLVTPIVVHKHSKC